MAVSGPRHENIKKPLTFKALCQPANKPSGSAASCSAILAQSMSTLAGGGNSKRVAGRHQRAGLHHGRAILLIAYGLRISCSSATKHIDFGYFRASAACAFRPPRTAPQWAHDSGWSLIHCKRSCMRLATSSCSHGDASGATRCQWATASGSRVGGRWVVVMAVQDKSYASILTACLNTCSLPNSTCRSVCLHSSASARCATAGLRDRFARRACRAFLRRCIDARPARSPCRLICLRVQELSPGFAWTVYGTPRRLMQHWSR